MKLTRTFPWIAAFVLAASVTCFGQATSASIASPSLPNATSANQDNDVLKLLEITKIKLDAANDKIALLNDRLAAKDEIIRAKDGTIAVRDEQLTNALDANKLRQQVNTGDARMLSACETQLSKADARIYNLEHPGLLKSLFDTRTLTGFGLGYGVGRLQPK